MEIAALILSIISLLMSVTVTIVYLSTYVFSKRTIQMVPIGEGKPMISPEYDKQFEEFDISSGPIDAALKQ